MQEEKSKISFFVDSTDKLASVHDCNIRDLAPIIGISPALLFAGRSGKKVPSLKTLDKLDSALKTVGLSSPMLLPPSAPSVPARAPPRYVTDSLLNMGESMVDALKKGQAITAEAMWDAMSKPLAAAAALQHEIEKEQIEAMRPKPKITKGIALAADLHPPEP